jgi:hypothetical protein
VVLDVHTYVPGLPLQDFTDEGKHIFKNNLIILIFKKLLNELFMDLQEWLGQRGITLL